eukprot:scaffold200922_cov18-Prasinocladus_malaysianus.AAC.1
MQHFKNKTASDRRGDVGANRDMIGDSMHYESKPLPTLKPVLPLDLTSFVVVIRDPCHQIFDGRRMTHILRSKRACINDDAAAASGPNAIS